MQRRTSLPIPGAFLTAIVPLLFLVACKEDAEKSATYKSFSGVYPHLASYNDEGECGTGAVVPWADKLWVITYGPHLPNGSSDKLYEIDDKLRMTVRQESVGGTPANRLIHSESEQLFIGPYAIDKNGQVRVISYADAPGRYTGAARHLHKPDQRIYIATMEEGFYEVDARSLETETLYPDGNGNAATHVATNVNPPNQLLPGAHGKGLYSGQGVLVYTNNGEATPEALKKFDVPAGVLAEWDGQVWTVIRRNQFVEVTGPGGINGNRNPESDPIWATGWDHKSVIVAVRDSGRWEFFRLPKASHSYDGAHGWNTEWPRIRDIGTTEAPDYLMTMHGMFWRFPGTFKSGNTVGIRPRSAYLKVIGDFARWNNQLVFGCDDSAQKEFLNRRKVKGGIEGPGQSNSNLWFTSFELPDQLGPTTAEGAVWLRDSVIAGEISEPFLFAGWPGRSAWIRNDGSEKVTFTFEVDEDGNDKWKELRSLPVGGGASALVTFPEGDQGEWIRVTADIPTVATVHFYYNDVDERSTSPEGPFGGIADVNEREVSGGLLYGLGENRRTLGISAVAYSGEKKSGLGYYELTAAMQLESKDDQEMLEFINEKFAIPENVVTVDQASVLVVDDQGRRWRLPLGNEAFTDLTNRGDLRIAREVATERDLFNCHGTFYELPAENADGFAKIRPVASHNYRIHDYASYRGMLIVTGINPDEGEDNPHIIRSDDGKVAVWAGVIDDLWKMGKPVGRGGPWKYSQVNEGEPSDPYLIGFYDKRKLSLSHDSKETVKFTIEVEPIGHGPWMIFKEISVPAGETVIYDFPQHFQARWIRFTVDKSVSATAWLDYR